MARIDEFFHAHPERQAAHPTQVACGWCVVSATSGPLLQLSTYGSEDRQIHGKVTQTLQLNESNASDLIQIILQVFPGVQVARGSK